jgi:hypothetical protein
MQNILISTSAGPRKVEAEIVGPFAIHRDINKPHYYTLTHLFTASDITPAKYLDYDEARILIEAITPLCDWYAVSYLDYRSTGNGFHQFKLNPDTRAKMEPLWEYLKSNGYV